VNRIAGVSSGGGVEDGVAANLSSLVNAADKGDSAAARALFATLYSELHRIAKRELARHGASISVSATTLIHEAYLDIAARDGPLFPDHGRFIAYAARAMRGLIIDHVRRRQAQKRGAAFDITSLTTQVREKVIDHRELAVISDALDELVKIEPALTEVVDLKFFCGMSFSEIAAVKGVSERTAQRMWEKARLYLHRCIRPNLSL
jgi:RNA polymerase sigma factor (TIGR02999 family)